MSIPLPEFETSIPMIASAKTFSALDCVATAMDFPFFVENNQPREYKLRSYLIEK
jgi:hypothetical protein